METTKSWVVRVEKACSKSCFEPHSPRYGVFLVRGYGRPMCTNSMASGGILGAVHGHIVELEGRGRPFSMAQCNYMGRVATISLHSVVFSKFWGGFGQKKGRFWPQNADFEMEVRHLRKPFPAATVEVVAHTLWDCRLHPQVASTKILAESKAPRRSSAFAHFACASCLLAACLLAKRGRCTPNTKCNYEDKWKK